MILGLLLGCQLAITLPSAEPLVGLPTPTVAPPHAPAIAKPAVPDLRDALASTTRERNTLAEKAEQVTKQYWLLIVYGMVMTVVAGWLGLALLRRSASPKTKPADDPLDDFSGTTVTVRQRKNATITIRNRETQREEVVSNVETRRMFARSETSSETKANPTTRSYKRPLEQVPQGENELRPSTDRTTRATTPAAQPITNRRQVTVRVEHHSDRLAPVDVQLKPGTGAMVRNGFTMLEVMISLAVLATVLASVMGSIYTLHTAQIQAKERARVEELGRLLTERLMGAQWDSIGRRDQSDANFGAWSWHRRHPELGDAVAPRLPPLHEGREIPDDQNLEAIGLLSGPSELDDLKVYLEYYKRDALEALLTFTPDPSDPDHTLTKVWAESRQLHRIDEETPDDLSTSPTIQIAPTLVFRIIITWKAYRAGDCRHDVLFARSK